MYLRGMLSFCAPAAVVIAGLSAPIVLAASGSTPRPGTAFIIMTPPWQSAAARIAEVDGVVLAKGRLPFLALTLAHTETMTQNLQDAGPVMFLGSSWEAALCA